MLSTQQCAGARAGPNSCLPWRPYSSVAFGQSLASTRCLLRKGPNAACRRCIRFVPRAHRACRSRCPQALFQQPRWAAQMRSHRPETRMPKPAATGRGLLKSSGAGYYQLDRPSHSSAAVATHRPALRRQFQDTFRLASTAAVNSMRPRPSHFAMACRSVAVIEEPCVIIDPVSSAARIRSGVNRRSTSSLGAPVLLTLLWHTAQCSL